MDKGQTFSEPSFGVITDIQYADVEDGTDFSKTRERYYRNSLVQAQEAVRFWRDSNVDFAINLGDTIDGKCKRHGQSHSALQSVLDVFKDLNKPVYHLWGNHEYYNFQRDALLKMRTFNFGPLKTLHSLQENKIYYSTKVSQNLRIVAINAYEISTLGHKLDSEGYKRASRILSQNNPNTDKNSADGLSKFQRRFVSFNGAVGETQLQWLNQVLTDADKNEDHVIVMSHVAVHIDAANSNAICWDSEDVLAVLHKHPCVFTVFAGHDHDGGFVVDDHHIHHITFPGVVETHPSSSAHAVVHIRDTGLEIEGVGRVPSRFVPYRRNYRNSEATS